MIYPDDFTLLDRFAASAAPLAYAVVMGAHASIDARFERVEGAATEALFGAGALALGAAFVAHWSALAGLATSTAAVALAAWAVGLLDGARVRMRPGGVHLQARASAVHAAIEWGVLEFGDFTLSGLLVHAVAVVPVVLFAWERTEHAAAHARPLPDPPDWRPMDVAALDAIERRDDERARAMDAPDDDAVRRGPPKVRSIDDRP